MPAPLIRLDGICKSFPSGGGPVWALKDVGLRVEPGEFLALSGPSGSGKSTLLNLIGCIEKPDSGRIEIDGRDVTDEPLDRLARLRARRLGYVFQTFNLLPVLTAAENVEYPLSLNGVPAGERAHRAAELLREVGLDGLGSRRPSGLSGGQRQRVAIARALAAAPALVLADEPTANLDARSGSEVLELMRGLNRKSGVTFVFSTHDPRVLAFAGRIARLADGRVVPEGQ